MFEYVKSQISQIREEIAFTAEKTGRSANAVKLLAVSKTFPAEAVAAAYKTGQRIFGENRVQELKDKVPDLPKDIAWHLIGHLQSNKVAQALDFAGMIHSVDSKKLLERLNRIAREKNLIANILFEVNISGEKSKFGMSQEETKRLADSALKLENINLHGLMTMAPFGSDEKKSRTIFSALRILKEEISKNTDRELPELSMGMSSDYKEAIKEGATLLRIGSAIFGKRTCSNQY